jgi:hypothetical protein
MNYSLNFIRKSHLRTLQGRFIIIDNGRCLEELGKSWGRPQDLKFLIDERGYRETG